MHTFKFKKLNKIFIILLIAGMVSTCLFSGEVNALTEKEKQNQQITKKIIDLKRKEKIEIRKLTKTQKKLESTEKNIKVYKNKLWKSKSNLSTLQNRLQSLSNEQQRAEALAGKRLRSIYKGERVDLIHLIFSANNISTLLDRIYYQQRISKQDAEILENLKKKYANVLHSRRAISYEKSSIASDISYMNRQKKQLDSSIKSSHYMINKLKTDQKAYTQAQKELAYLSGKIEDRIKKINNNSNAITTSFIKPVIGYISSNYGWRRHPVFKSRRFHSGVDIAGRNRSSIKAANQGKVIYSGWYGGYGKVVIVDHGTMSQNMYGGRYTKKKFSTLYAHMYNTAVKKGDYVRKGQVVGYEGTTGYSTGPHLHFEIRINGKHTNPNYFVKLR